MFIRRTRDERKSEIARSKTGRDDIRPRRYSMKILGLQLRASIKPTVRTRTGGTSVKTRVYVPCTYAFGPIRPPIHGAGVSPCNRGTRRVCRPTRVGGGTRRFPNGNQTTRVRRRTVGVLSLAPAVLITRYKNARTLRGGWGSGEE